MSTLLLKHTLSGPLMMPASPIPPGRDLKLFQPQKNTVLVSHGRPPWYVGIGVATPCAYADPTLGSQGMVRMAGKQVMHLWSVLLVQSSIASEVLTLLIGHCRRFCKRKGRWSHLIQPLWSVVRDLFRGTRRMLLVKLFERLDLSRPLSSFRRWDDYVSDCGVRPAELAYRIASISIIPPRNLPSLMQTCWISIILMPSTCRCLLQWVTMYSRVFFPHSCQQLKCLADLKDCKQSNIPVYSFTEHQRLQETKYLYGATVIIGEYFRLIWSVDLDIKRSVKPKA